MPDGQQQRIILQSKTAALLFIAVEVFGGVLFSLFAFGSERLKNALNRVGIEVIVVARMKSQHSEVTYYSPKLKALRYEGPEKTVIIQFAKRRGFVIFKRGKRVVREIEFEKFRRADELAQRYTRDLVGVSIGNGATHYRKWAMLKMSSDASDLGGQRCFWADLVNQFNERLSMCVIRDARVRQLAFLKEFTRNIPSQLQDVVEDSAELFLYSQGIVPIHWKKKGKTVNLQRLSTETILPKWFEPPVLVKREDYGSHYKNLYFKALNLQ